MLKQVGDNLKYKGEKVDGLDGRLLLLFLSRTTLLVYFIAFYKYRIQI